METHHPQLLDTDCEVMVKRLFIVAELLTNTKLNLVIMYKHLPILPQNQPAADVRYREGVQKTSEDRQDATT